MDYLSGPNEHLGGCTKWFKSAHHRVGSLMTTTERSLKRVRDIIDEYVAQGFHDIFLRPLSPYGDAMKTKAFDRYTAEGWRERRLGCDTASIGRSGLDRKDTCTLQLSGPTSFSTKANSSRKYSTKSYENTTCDRPGDNSIPFTR
jgi:hypothetical protein